VGDAKNGKQRLSQRTKTSIKAEGGRSHREQNVNGDGRQKWNDFMSQIIGEICPGGGFKGRIGKHCNKGEVEGKICHVESNEVVRYLSRRGIR